MSLLPDTSLNGLTSTPPRTGVILSDVGNVDKATSQILSEDLLFDGEFYQKYIRISENPPSVNIDIFHQGFDLVFFQTELSQYIDKIYGRGYYFDGLDVATLELFLYGTLEEIKSKLPVEEGALRVSDMIKKIPIPSNVLTAIYDGEVRFSDRDRTQASYFPRNSISKIYQMIGEANINNEEYVTMRKDYFHAFFWNNHRIKYHGVSQFLASIDRKKRDELDSILLGEGGKVISIKRPKTATIHEELEWNKFSKRNLSHPIGANGKIDLTKPACVFPQAQCGDWIVKIVHGKLGIAGICPDGTREDPESINKINLVNVLYDIKNPRIDIVNMDDEGVTYVVPNVDGFVIRVGNKIDFSEKMKYIGNIGGSGNMGSFHVPDNTDFILQGDVKKGYSISAYSVTYYGELCGEIVAKKDIQVVRGSILGGEIDSLDGDIRVNEGAKIQNNSSLTALNGTVTITANVENTVIMADEINIIGTAANCILIGRKVSVGTNNGSKIMAESMRVGKDMSPETSEYTLLLYTSTERIIALAKQKQEFAEGEINKIKERQALLMGQFNALDKSDLRRKDIVQEGASLKKRFEGITQQGNQIKEIASFFDGGEILFKGPSVRLVIERSPFIMSNTLHSLLVRQEELPLREKQKKDGYAALADRLVIGGKKIVYTGSNHSRSAILESLKLDSVDSLRSDSERIIVYNRMQLPVRAEGIVGSLYDYSDGGCAFVLKKSKIDSDFNITRNDHINLTIMDRAQAFIVARVDSDFIIGGEVYYKIAGSFEKKGVGKEIGIEIMSREQAKNSK